MDAPLHPVDRLAAKYWAFEAYETPFNAVLAGQPISDDTLFRESHADYERKDAGAAAMLDELAAIDRSGLTAQQAATFDLLGHELRLIRDLFRVEAHLRPFLFPVGPDFNTIFLANSTALNSVRDAETYLRRLAGLPGFVDDLIANFEIGRERGHRYPRVVLERAIGVVDGYLADDVEKTGWYGPFERSSVRARIKETADRAKSVIEQALLPKFRAYRDYLAETLLPIARESISCTDDPGGEDYYDVMVRRFTTTDLSPAEIHALGLSEVERIDGEIDALGREAGYPDGAAFQNQVTHSDAMVAPDADVLLQSIESLAKRIDGRIPEFFGNLPRITYGIRSMSAGQSERMPPAYAQPSSARRDQAGLFWVSAIPAKCPGYMHVPLTLHEAWPGHLMHIALIQEAEALPAFRRFSAVKYTAFIEGWALYCEILGIEMGMYRRPEDHFGRLDMEKWRAVRLVVDTGIHAKGWSREQAIDYMREHLSLSLDTIEAEVDRYIALPGQALGYQIGARAMRGLRERMEAALGDDFVLRDFHDAVTSAGAVTLPVLERLVASELGAGHANAA
jgi:uncharacterized protein (DUF885 family)